MSTSMGQLQSIFPNAQNSAKKHYIGLPPTATITRPLSQRASSLARNVAARATITGKTKL
jgi:hypothetical protein